MRIAAAFCLAAFTAHADASLPVEKDGSALFEMLGMADEYIGRYGMAGKPSDQVEHFYPHEQALGQRYEQLIREFAAARGFKPEYRRELRDDHVYFHSRKLAALIDAKYVWVMNHQVATLDRQVLRRASRADQIRYLRGFFARFQWEKTNIGWIANGSTKLLTVAEVLVRLGVHGVAVSATVGTIPNVERVIFQRGGPLDDLVRDWRTEIGDGTSQWKQVPLDSVF